MKYMKLTLKQLKKYAQEGKLKSSQVDIHTYHGRHSVTAHPKDFSKLYKYLSWLPDDVIEVSWYTVKDLTSHNFRTITKAKNLRYYALVEENGETSKSESDVVPEKLPKSVNYV